jgi:hypothetical protein
VKLNLKGMVDGHGWPAYLFGGRMRTSTAALILAFITLFWVYQTYQPQPVATEAPTTQVVPPGFVPDPDYTWVPRTNVRERPTITETTPPTTTDTTTTTPPSGTTTGPSTPSSTPVTPTTSGPESPTPTPSTTAMPMPGPSPTTPAPPR